MTDVPMNKPAAKPARGPARGQTGGLWGRPGFVAAVLKGHSALGLAFAALLYVVCLTGTLAVFVNEFKRWETNGAPRLEQVTPQAVQAAVEEVAQAAGEGLEHVFIYMPDDAFPALRLSADGKVGRTWIADAQGRLVADAATPWTEFLIGLHVYLHLPRSWGLFLVGMTGVALLSSLISGVLAHPRIFRDAFHLRLGGSRRLQEADLHNRIGVWALPFHAIISTTGALLGLSTLIVGVLGMALFQGDVGKVYALFQVPEPAEDSRPAPVPDLIPLFARVAAESSGAIAYIRLEHPTEAGGFVRFDVKDGSQRLADKDSFTFTRDGSLFHLKRAAENNLGEGILGALGPVHFGWFAGGVIRVAYGLLGLGLTYLCINGVTIWLSRRRDKGRPAPGWERVWTAIIWGQPVALAAAALPSLLLPGQDMGTALLVWGLVTLGCLLPAIRLSPERISRLGRGAAAALLVLLPVLHSILRPGADPMAWTVNAVLLLTGLALATTLRRKAG